MNHLVKQAKKRSWATILLGLPFAAVGIGLFCISILPTLYDWSRMSHWEPVSAELLDARLQRQRGEDSITYNVQARYRYIYDGQIYEQDRVAINTASDNIGDFQESLGRRLESLLATKASLEVWVNPERPEEAIIDRSLRLQLMLFKSVFVLVFGGIGIGIIIASWRKSNDLLEQPDAQQRPWLTHRAWADNKIRSEAKATVWFASIFAVIWNLISFPVAILILPSALADKDYPALIVLAFPLVGLGLAYWAIKATLDWRRFGDPVLVLDPFPGAIGGHFGAQLELPMTCTSGSLFKVVLNCLLVETSVGKDKETRESLHWQAEGLANVKSFTKTSLLSFYFNLPKQLPASEPEGGKRYYRWRLDIESQQLQPAFARSYIVPVYATAEQSYSLYQDAETHPLLQESREQQIDTVSDIEQVPGGIRLYLPYGRAPGNKLVGLCCGLFFAGFGVLAWAKDAPLFFSLIFGGLGFGIFLYALYSLTNSLHVQLDQQGLKYQRRILGVLVSNVEVPRSQIKKLGYKESYSTTSGSKHETVYRVQVELVSGKTYTLVDSLKGRATADQMLESVSLLTGYP